MSFVRGSRSAEKAGVGSRMARGLLVGRGKEQMGRMGRITKGGEAGLCGRLVGIVLLLSGRGMDPWM